MRICSLLRGTTRFGFKRIEIKPINRYQGGHDGSTKVHINRNGCVIWGEIIREAVNVLMKRTFSQASTRSPLYSSRKSCILRAFPAEYPASRRKALCLKDPEGIQPRVFQMETQPDHLALQG